jgi:hypothetical protein
MMSRERDTGVRLDALVRGTECAQTGTNGAETTIGEGGFEYVEELYPAT